MIDYGVEDEYVREFRFEPELLLTKKDSIRLHKRKYEESKAKHQQIDLFDSKEDIITSDYYQSSNTGCSSSSSTTANFSISNVRRKSLAIDKSELEIEIESFYYMYGRYTKDLGEYAKDEARKLKLLEKRRKKEDKLRNKELLGKRHGRLFKVLSWIWKHTFARLGEDWVFLALLGIIMALLSFIMDKGISICTNARVWLYRDLTNHIVTQYFAWISLPVALILFSAGFVHLVAPQSIGSGIPEMKTILRGVALKEYLTFKTLVAKVIGLTATLGSGMPLGKEGPFVHIASIVAQLLSKLITSFQGIYENESRNSEMLAAACAVGVGACFAAPVGGVLFSIEVTTTYFAVRNYWRGFFAAVCGATVFRLLAVWFQNADTVRAFFLTSFTADFPFDPQELFVYALMGVICGLGGALYVWVHRHYVLFMRSNKKMNKFLQKNRFLYPGIIALIVSTITFPLFTGQFIAGELSTHEQVTQLFTNFTWTRPDLTIEQTEVVSNWMTPYTDVFINLACYVVFTFFFSIIASTIPVPSGIFIPVFKIGAGIGRLVGEGMHTWFPSGVRYGGRLSAIIPGGYAVVGAAAFSGAVTHTVSVAVIVFEMTGQITHVVPVMIAVLISNAIAALLQPSMYDSIILIKKLPYLPDLLPSSSAMYSIYVEDFMVRDLQYIWQNISYQKLKEILKSNKALRSLPLVDNPENMILLGSVQRYELIKMIDKHIGREKRMEVAQKWKKEAEERIAREEEERIKKEQEEAAKIRRPSRFEVLPAPDILALRQQFSNDETKSLEKTNSSNALTISQPKKSILKKTNSFNLKGLHTPSSPTMTPYTTITGNTEYRIRSAFEAIFRKAATLQDVNPPDSQNASQGNLTGNEHHTIHHTPSISKKVQLPRERVIDMSPEDQKIWEMEEMLKPIDLEAAHVNIDPSPFQLVERTSILKVHSLFSMVGINHAYVTKIGRLVGVVGLKELRKAIEDINSNNFTIQSALPLPIEIETDAEGQKNSKLLEPLLMTPPPLLQPKNSDKQVNLTITSMDSALSNSENCSDIELDSLNNAKNNNNNKT
ncbi:chloride channel protein 2 isoform X2 [Condylostylus longicornis]|uniref:chloride channel protein 2 isoform X2 n=1 Tax=Condylostylus longicornis TaxID=2530218 RepID=UPI00244E1D3F|nr:chloride channel protein 2 isoform X2 [Condylostylus longicornis]